MRKFVYILLLIVLLVIGLFYSFTYVVEEKNVVLKGYIVGIVSDYKESSSIYYIQTDGKTYKLNISNAKINLSKHFSLYIGNPDNQVIVKGILKGDTIIAYEIRDSIV